MTTETRLALTRILNIQSLSQISPQLVQELQQAARELLESEMLPKQAQNRPTNPRLKVED